MSKSNPASNPVADLRSVRRATRELELFDLRARQAETLRALDKERRPPRDLTKEATEFLDQVGDGVASVTRGQLDRLFPDDPDPAHERTVFNLANERDRQHREIERLKREGVRVIGAQEAQAIRRTLTEGMGARPALSQGRPAASKRRKAKRRTVQQKPVTAKQAEAVLAVSECNGNFTNAAKRLQVTRKTARQHYWTAMRKLGVTIQSSPQQIARAQHSLEAVGRNMKKPAMREVPTDARGQLAISKDARRS